MASKAILLVWFAALAVSSIQAQLQIVSRNGWGAKSPKSVEIMPNPVPYVVIHHSAIPAACTTHSACINAMQWMQQFHQVDRGWNDIGYSFAVGGDGLAYEGRGWSAVGAHAPNYNAQSIGICLIGDWSNNLPPARQLNAAQQLIALGVQRGLISANYRLVGHRQVTSTACPGNRLYQEITRWNNFAQRPFDEVVENDFVVYNETLDAATNNTQL